MTGFSGWNNDNGLWLILLLIVFGGFNNNCGTCGNVAGTTTCGCNNVLGTNTCGGGNEAIWLLLLLCLFGNNGCNNNCIAGCGCS